MTFAYKYNNGWRKIRKGKFREFGEIAKIANIKPRETFPLYGRSHVIAQFIACSLECDGEYRKFPLKK